MSVVKLDLDADIAGKLKFLVETYGDHNLFFDQFINFYKSKLEREIAGMEIDLKQFEGKYQMNSDDFYKKFEDGNLGDDHDYIIWSGIFEMLSNAKEKLRKLSS